MPQQGLQQTLRELLEPALTGLEINAESTEGRWPAWRAPAAGRARRRPVRRAVRAGKPDRRGSRYPPTALASWCCVRSFRQSPRSVPEPRSARWTSRSGSPGPGWQLARRDLRAGAVDLRHHPSPVSHLGQPAVNLADLRALPGSDPRAGSPRVTECRELNQAQHFAGALECVKFPSGLDEIGGGRRRDQQSTPAGRVARRLRRETGAAGRQIPRSRLHHLRFWSSCRR